MKYKNYYNFELGNRDIYSHNDILGMTVQDLFDNELPLSYQYNTIGIPKDDELISSPNTHQYTNANGKLRWRSSSKTTEELLEEERQRRAEQEAQTANVQSQLAGFGQTASVVNSAPKQTVESPMMESEPLVDNNTMSKFVGLAKDKFQNRKETDNNGMKNAKSSFQQESVMSQPEPQIEEPNYYEENLPVEQDDELFESLNEYLNPEINAEQKLEGKVRNTQDEHYPIYTDDGRTVIKGHVEEAVNPYDLIQQDPTLSTEAKIAKIKELTEARNKEIVKANRKKMARIWGGAALEVGSFIIPGTIGAKAVRGLTKAMTPIAKKLAPKLGKKVVGELINDTAKSTVSSPFFSIGDEMLNGNDISKSTISSTAESIAKDIAKAPFFSKIRQLEKGLKLSKVENFDNLTKYQKRRMQDKFLQYYDDYVEGTVKYKTPKQRSSHQLRDKEWLEWLRKAKLRKW